MYNLLVSLALIGILDALAHHVLLAFGSDDSIRNYQLNPSVDFPDEEISDLLRIGVRTLHFFILPYRTIWIGCPPRCDDVSRGDCFKECQRGTSK